MGGSLDPHQEAAVLMTAERLDIQDRIHLEELRGQGFAIDNMSAEERAYTLDSMQPQQQQYGGYPQQHQGSYYQHQTGGGYQQHAGGQQNEQLEEALRSNVCKWLVADGVAAERWRDLTGWPKAKGLFLKAVRGDNLRVKRAACRSVADFMVTKIIEKTDVDPDAWWKTLAEFDEHWL
jgi:hypothetical protein